MELCVKMDEFPNAFEMTIVNVTRRSKLWVQKIDCNLLLTSRDVFYWSTKFSDSLEDRWEMMS